MSHDPLCGLSSLLMLVGCYLVAMPHLFNYRDLGGLLELLLVMNIHEAMVILTFGYLVRRAPSSQEAPLLLLVEFLFVLDATMTASACIPVSIGGGIGIAAASLILAVAKLYALELAAGREGRGATGGTMNAASRGTGEIAARESGNDEPLRAGHEDRIGVRRRRPSA